MLALISLSLGVINLFPFLPLDGGHVFWAVAEKVRGKRIPFEVMERAGVVGFVLILMLFVDRPQQRHLDAELGRRAQHPLTLAGASVAGHERGDSRSEEESMESSTHVCGRRRVPSTPRP